MGDDAEASARDGEAVNKSIPETRRYDVRAPNDGSFTRKGAWLGTFLITHDGMVAVNSDYGTYGYWWNSTGRDDIREFLIKIDTDYLLGKIAPKQEYDPQETEKSVKRKIIELRRANRIDKEQARTERDLVSDSDFSCELGFYDWMKETKIGDAYELACYRTDRQAVAFAERVWPVFCDMLRAEMKREKEST